MRKIAGDELSLFENGDDTLLPAGTRQNGVVQTSAIEISSLVEPGLALTGLKTPDGSGFAFQSFNSNTSATSHEWIVGDGGNSVASASLALFSNVSLSNQNIPTAEGPIEPDRTISVASTTGFTINLKYDAAALAPGAASFRAGIEQAKNILEAAITDKITVNIIIHYSGANGGAFADPDSSLFDSYSQVRGFLINNATPGDHTFDALAVGSSIQGQSQVRVFAAQEKLFGQLSPNDTTTDDGSATFGTQIDPSFLVGVALHELTHALGRVPSGPEPDIFDLFRFVSPGNRFFDGYIPPPNAAGPPAGASYFSLDGGNTKLADYGQWSDPSDFLNPANSTSLPAPHSDLTPNDPFNEQYGGGTLQQLTPIDLKQLDALGFHIRVPDTTSPSLVHEGPITVAVGNTGIISSSQLQFDDNVSTHAQETYTVITGPTYGALLKSGSNTTSFTQADIDNGLISYSENGSVVSSDSFTFRVTDAAGNSTGTTPFQINITSSPGPDTITLQPGAEGQDLWITNTFSYNDDYGVDNEQLKVGGWGDVYDSLIKFDLGAVHASHVSSATLKLYSLGDSGSTPTGISVEQLQRSWDETYGWFAYGGVRGSPTSDPVNLTYQHLSTVGAPGVGWMTIDVTAAVNSWLADPASNNGLLLRPLSTNNNFDFFVSSDSVGTNAQFHPTLVLQTDVTPSAGSLAINDVSLTEGNSGTKIETFTATRTGGTAAFDINFATADGTATIADHDYLANAGTLHFGDSVNTQTISVTINGDTNVEPSENFFINLSGATNGATISDGQGTGTIINDDGHPSAPLHDFNGDFSSDLLWRQNGGTFTEWQSTGNSFTSNVVVDSTVSNAWHSEGAFDFSGDGRADLLWRNGASGQFTIWDSTGNGFTQNDFIGNGVDTSWTVAGLADFNGDGRSDILWRQSGGTFTEWQSTGTGFTPNVVVVASVDTSWHLAATADFNGDGMADLLWRNNNGTFTEWQSTGNGFTPNVVNISSVDPTWHVLGTGDFNGDGKTDLLWRNNNGTFTEWQSTGNGFTPNVVVNSSVNNTWHLAQVADFNGDRNADLLWRNDNGTFTEWQSTGNGFTQNVVINTTVATDWTLITHHYDLV